MGALADILVARGGYNRIDAENAERGPRAEELAREFGVSSGGGRSIPSFNFDYEAEARNAYGELGPYYLRLLTESQGDTNKILSRLVEDYDRGLRIKREDRATTETALVESERRARRNVVDNALTRGLYTKSAFAPEQGFGIADTNLIDALYPIQTRRQLADTALKRYEEQADITKTRTTEDTREKQKRYEFDLEQRKRKEAAELANTRGSRAYQKYISENQLV